MLFKASLPAGTRWALNDFVEGVLESLDVDCRTIAVWILLGNFAPGWLRLWSTSDHNGTEEGRSVPKTYLVYWLPQICVVARKMIFGDVLSQCAGHSTSRLLKPLLLQYHAHFSAGDAGEPP